MSIDISIDPGINTGVCMWTRGKVFLTKTIAPPRSMSTQPFFDRALWIRRELITLWQKYEIKRIAIETFEGHTEHPTLKLMKCSQVQGMLFGLAADWAKEVIGISKRQIRQKETLLLAKSYGVADGQYGSKSEHALAAFQIGVCAGFDRK